MKKLFLVLFLLSFGFQSSAETVSIQIQNTTIDIHYNVKVKTKDTRYKYHTDAFIPTKYKQQFQDIVTTHLSKYSTTQLLIFGPREIFVCEAITGKDISYAGMNLGDNKIAVKLSLNPNFGEVIHHEVAHEILRKYNPHYQKNWTYTLLNELVQINSDQENVVNKAYFQCHKEGYVSDYAKEHIHEEFCEMFGIFLSGELYATEFIINNPNSILAKKFDLFRSTIKKHLNIDISA